jgi:hypothetical protein
MTAAETSVSQAPLSQPSPQVDYYSPLVGGGSMLDSMLDSAGEYIKKRAFNNAELIHEDLAGPGDVGEPLNVIISGLSSPEVLTDAGFLNFARAIG